MIDLLISFFKLTLTSVFTNDEIKKKYKEIKQKEEEEKKLKNGITQDNTEEFHINYTPTDEITYRPPEEFLDNRGNYNMLDVLAYIQDTIFVEKQMNKKSIDLYEQDAYVKYDPDLVEEGDRIEEITFANGEKRKVIISSYGEKELIVKDKTAPGGEDLKMANGQVLLYRSEATKNTFETLAGKIPATKSFSKTAKMYRAGEYINYKILKDQITEYKDKLKNTKNEEEIKNINSEIEKRKRKIFGNSKINAKNLLNILKKQAEFYQGILDNKKFIAITEIKNPKGKWEEHYLVGKGTPSNKKQKKHIENQKKNWVNKLMNEINIFNENANEDEKIAMKDLLNDNKTNNNIEKLTTLLNENKIRNIDDFMAEDLIEKHLKTIINKMKKRKDIFKSPLSKKPLTADQDGKREIQKLNFEYKNPKNKKLLQTGLIYFPSFGNGTKKQFSDIIIIKNPQKNNTPSASNKIVHFPEIGCPPTQTGGNRNNELRANEPQLFIDAAIELNTPNGKTIECDFAFDLLPTYYKLSENGYCVPANRYEVWDDQISTLSVEKVEKYREKLTEIDPAEAQSLNGNNNENENIEEYRSVYYAWLRDNMEGRMLDIIDAKPENQEIKDQEKEEIKGITQTLFEIIDELDKDNEGNKDIEEIKDFKHLYKNLTEASRANIIKLDTKLKEKIETYNDNYKNGLYAKTDYFNALYTGIIMNEFFMSHEKQQLRRERAATLIARNETAKKHVTKTFSSINVDDYPILRDAIDSENRK